MTTGNETAPAMPPVEAMLEKIEWRPTGAQRGVDDLPYATHEGELRLSGYVLRCYRLNDGRAIFHADDVRRFFGLSA